MVALLSFKDKETEAQKGSGTHPSFISSNISEPSFEHYSDLSIHSYGYSMHTLRTYFLSFLLFFLKKTILMFKIQIKVG